MAQYSDDQKATALAALDANGGNLALTARQLNIPRTTLIRWQRGEAHPVVSELRQEKKMDLATALEDVAYQLLDAMPGKIAEATLQQVSTSLGIAIDKMQLLRGKPTGILQNDDSSHARLLQRLLPEFTGDGAPLPVSPLDAGRVDGSAL